MIEAIIFDYGRTLADVDTHQLLPGAEKVLADLRARGLKMAVVSRASKPQQRSHEFVEHDLGRYFQVFEVIPSEGAKEFVNVLRQLRVKSENCAVVGDRIRSEIVEGNRAGLTTVWLRQGKFADELPGSLEEEPNYTVMSLEEVTPLVDLLRQ